MTKTSFTDRAKRLIRNLRRLTDFGDRIKLLENNVFELQQTIASPIALQSGGASVTTTLNEPHGDLASGSLRSAPEASSPAVQSHGVPVERPIQLRLIALEAELAAVRRDTASRPAGLGDPAVLSAKISALETRVDLISSSISALRSEVAAGPVGADAIDESALKEAILLALRDQNASLDARFANVFEVLNSAQAGTISQYNSLFKRIAELEARVAYTQPRASEPAPATA